MTKLRRTFSLYRAGLGGATPLAALIIPLVCASCFFATKQDIDRLQADIVGTRASSGAADSVQRAQLVELSRSVRAVNDSISALSRKVAAMRTASESEMTAMRENISQLQDLSGQSEQRMRRSGSNRTRQRLPRLRIAPARSAHRRQARGRSSSCRLGVISCSRGG